MRIGGQPGSLAVVHEAERRRLRVAIRAESTAGLIEVRDRLRRLFDVDADAEAIDEVLGQSPLLREDVRARPGARVPGAFDGFETAVRAILGQQVSVKGARTIAGRIARRWGDALPEELALGAGLDHLFPEPERLARAPLEEVGLTGARADAIRALARAVRKDASLLVPGQGLEASLASWTRLPGVGPWTAQIIAMRVLREPDALPAGDLGLRKAASESESKPCSSAEVEKRLEGCRPYRAYGALRLWARL